MVAGLTQGYPSYKPRRWFQTGGRFILVEWLWHGSNNATAGRLLDGGGCARDALTTISLSPLRVKVMILLVEVVGRKVGKKGEYHKKLEVAAAELSEEEVLERS